MSISLDLIGECANENQVYFFLLVRSFRVPQLRHAISPARTESTGALRFVLQRRHTKTFLNMRASASGNFAMVCTFT